MIEAAARVFAIVGCAGAIIVASACVAVLVFGWVPGHG